ncbi:MAG: alpha/beta hydrolase [Tannerellaceae bacterium]|jgi:pimeloyl-ACP methyl ester carboxylesterase|nr:alpha/beta hydrolase [Tannerellaceae bacterium]
MIHKIIQNKTANIHYFLHKNESSGELIVFLHGAYADHTCFNRQKEAFTSRYNVIFIDLLGHGLSNVFTMKDRIDETPEQIKRILEIEKFAKAHFVGVSLGALLAQYMAFKYPEYVSSLVAVGGYNIHDNNDAINKAQKDSVRKCLWMALSSMNKFRRYVARQAVHNPENREHYYQMAKKFIRKSFVTMRGLKNVIRERPANPVNYPLLILCGELDLELAQNAAQRWHQQTTGSQCKTIPQAGHTANMDNPGEFNRIVLGFLEED